jgi:curved DNA-binding protein CbpA
MKNYYYILGLQKDAEEQEIRTAYKKLSMLLHPDRNGGDRFFEDRFKEIQEAYNALSHPTRRAAYDEELLTYSQPQNNSTFNANPPSILQFEASKKAIAEGELVTIMWRVSNADSVHIDPLGLVEAVGTKTIRLPSMLERPLLVLRLTATNTFVQKSQSRELNIQNKSFKTAGEPLILGQTTNEKTEEQYTNTANTTAKQPQRRPKPTTSVMVQPPKAKSAESGRGMTREDVYTYIIIFVMAVIMMGVAITVFQLKSKG